MTHLLLPPGQGVTGPWDTQGHSGALGWARGTHSEGQGRWDMGKAKGSLLEPVHGLRGLSWDPPTMEGWILPLLHPQTPREAAAELGHPPE